MISTNWTVITSFRLLKFDENRVTSHVGITISMSPSINYKKTVDKFHKKSIGCHFFLVFLLSGKLGIFLFFNFRLNIISRSNELLEIHNFLP